MRKRWIVCGIVGVLLAGSVTGIAIHSEWLQSRWNAAQAATTLSDKLENLDGVTRVEVDYDPFGLPEHTVDVSLTFSPKSTPADWSKATKLVHSASSAPGAIPTIITAEFREKHSRASATVEPLLIEPDVVASEITAWRSLLGIVGDRVSLRLGTETPGSGGNPVRRYTVGAAEMQDVAARWPAELPAVTASIPTQWVAPGIDYGVAPTSDGMAMVNALANTLPLLTLDPKPKPGLYLMVMSDFRGIRVGILPTGVADPTEGAMDPRAVEAARAALAAGASGIDWVSTTRSASLQVGECKAIDLPPQDPIPTSLSTIDEDLWLATELEEAGLALPIDVHPGFCMPQGMPRL
ncbi:MAG TPA: hypothetical protein VNT53_09375 [Pseudolysinimonas sp.]|nr:hypothetical protein [Pseudolysinimonas sp.]